MSDEERFDGMFFTMAQQQPGGIVDVRRRNEVLIKKGRGSEIGIKKSGLIWIGFGHIIQLSGS